MKHSEFRAVQRKMEKLVDKWVGPLGLKGIWRITCRYRDSYFDPDTDGQGRGATAYVTPQWEYMQSEICFSIPSCAEAGEEMMDRIVVHELCHILVNQMREFQHYDGENFELVRGHEESVVTNLARAFMRTRDAGSAEGKRAERKAA